MAADRPKILYRVTATYADPLQRRYRRHFQSKPAAVRMVAALRAGYSREGGGTEDYWSVRYPPADTVTLEASRPVTWPEPEEAPDG